MIFNENTTCIMIMTSDTAAFFFETAVDGVVWFFLQGAEEVDETCIWRRMS